LFRLSGSHTHKVSLERLYVARCCGLLPSALRAHAGAREKVMALSAFSRRRLRRLTSGRIAFSRGVDNSFLAFVQPPTNFVLDCAETPQVVAVVKNLAVIAIRLWPQATPNHLMPKDD